MKWEPVESMAFWAAAYAERQALLYLLFRRGEAYRYFDVPRWQYQEFLAAESKGGTTFAGASATSECAGCGDDRLVFQKGNKFS